MVKIPGMVRKVGGGGGVCVCVCVCVCVGGGGGGERGGTHISRPKNISEDLLTFTTLRAHSADDKLMPFFFSYSSLRTGFDISYKFSPKETISMTCKSLFSGRNKETISKCCLLKFLYDML